DASAVGFTGYAPMPIRHGLTLGELARLFNGEQKIGADLTIVAMKNWRRDEWFDATGLAWTSPSPNMRNLLAATVYPGIGAIEGVRRSMQARGRGIAAGIDGDDCADSSRRRSGSHRRILGGRRSEVEAASSEVLVVLGHGGRGGHGRTGETEQRRLNGEDNSP